MYLLLTLPIMEEQYECDDITQPLIQVYYDNPIIFFQVWRQIFDKDSVRLYLWPIIVCINYKKHKWLFGIMKR